MLHVEQNTIISLRVRLVEVNIGHSACSACVMIDRAGIQIVQLLFFYRACSFDILHFKLFRGRRVEVMNIA